MIDGDIGKNSIKKSVKIRLSSSAITDYLNITAVVLGYFVVPVRNYGTITIKG